MKTIGLDKAIKILLFFFLAFAGLYFTKPFLAPFTIAMLLAMLFYPLAKKMESRGLGRGLSALFCVLMLLIAIGIIVTIFSVQLSGMADKIPQMKHHAGEFLQKTKIYISNTIGISAEKQEKMLQEQQSGTSNTDVIAAFMAGMAGVLVDAVLVMVYIFLLLYFRSLLKRSIIAMAPAGGKQTASTILERSTRVAAKYLGGLAMMIVMLWIMFSIGFSIVGIENAIFFAVLCGLLEIVPFVGNIAGTGVTMLMALSQGGGGGMVLGVFATYLVVQFVQTYILEPLVVGSEVNINPLFTIIVLVTGELVWGIPGMVVAIPMLGIVKVVCDSIEPLKPYGMLIGKEEKKSEKSWADKIKRWFGKK